MCAVCLGSNSEHVELIASTKRRVDNLEKDDLKKSRVEERSEEVEKSEEEEKPGVGASKVKPEKPEDERKEVEPRPEEYIIGIRYATIQWLRTVYLESSLISPFRSVLQIAHLLLQHPLSTVWLQPKPNI